MHVCGCLPKMDSNRDDIYLSNVSLLFKLLALVEIAFSLLKLRNQERLTCFWPSIHLFICPSIYSFIHLSNLPIYPFIYYSSHHLITYPLEHNLSTHVPTHSLIHTACIYLFNYSSHSSIYSLTHLTTYLSYLHISFLPCFLSFLPSSSLLLFS